MTFRVLFVCAANICRSPTAAQLFTSRLPESLEQVVTAESAGVRVVPGRPWCHDAQKWVKRHRFEVNGSVDHRSRHLSAVDLSGCDVILAADTEIKSAVLRADLRVRSQLFTLLEATTLAAGVQEALADSLGGRLNSDRLRLETLPRPPGIVRMRWLVSEMDAARGLVVPTGRGARAHTTDLLDPHAPGVRSSHRSTLRQLADAVTSLCHSMDLVNRARS